MGAWPPAYGAWQWQKKVPKFLHKRHPVQDLLHRSFYIPNQHTPKTGGQHLGIPRNSDKVSGLTKTLHV